MPFTVSHVAAVLPLHAWSKARLPLSALMIGSMSPDFPYFVPLAAVRFTVHNLPGLFWFCLPVGVAAWWLFVRFLERPTLALIPEPWRAGLPPPTHRISSSLAVRAAIGVLLGAVTHVVWDAFTHARTPVVEAIPALRRIIEPIAGLRLPLYELLQIASSALGLAVLVIWVLRLRRPPRADAHAPAHVPAYVHTLPAVSTRTRITAAATIVLTSCTMAAGYYAYSAGLRFDSRLFYLLMGGMTGWALAWFAVAAWLNVRWNATR